MKKIFWTTEIQVPSQQTRHIDPMLDQCLANVVDGGPTVIQHWVDVACLLGYDAVWTEWQLHIIETTTPVFFLNILDLQ